jgi:predicted metal-dependent peptidase
VDEFAADDPISFDPPGGGGTDFRPVFEWVRKQGIEPACLIFFTDLDGPMPSVEPGYPVLWCCVNKQQAPWGETINLPTEERG